MQLYTQRLILHPLAADELSLFLSSSNKLEAILECRYEGETLDNDFRNMITSMLTAVTNSKSETLLFHTLWLIITKNDRCIVGSIDFKGLPKERKVEIGYGLGAKHRKKGYMTEAVKAICSFAARFDDIDEVIAETKMDNIPSQNVLKSCNFEPYIEGDLIIMKKPLMIEKFWNKYLSSADLPMRPCPEVFAFGGEREQANELLNLVLTGKKTATSSAYPAYELEGEAIPQKGDISILTDFDGRPYCVLENTDVSLIPFGEMTFDICKREGEDDCLESWRKKHIDFFTKDASESGYIFNEEMIIVFEDFKVIWKDTEL